MRFRDRTEAGELLAQKIEELNLERPRILGIARGGVPVASPIARSLKRPLEILIVRKLGAPGNPEFGIGAITEEGISWVDPSIMLRLGISEEDLLQIREEESLELDRRVQLFRNGRPLEDLKNQEILLVDDGLATGGTAIAASIFLRKRGAKKIILAIPVAPKDCLTDLKQYFDQIVCLFTPDYFDSVGQWYKSFRQLKDEEVLMELKASDLKPQNKSS